MVAAAAGRPATSASPTSLASPHIAPLSLDKTRDYVRLQLDDSGVRSARLRPRRHRSTVRSRRRRPAPAHSRRVVRRDRRGLAQEEPHRRPGRPRCPRRPRPCVTHVHRHVLDELPPRPRPSATSAAPRSSRPGLHTAVRAALVALAARHPPLADLDHRMIRRPFATRALVDTCLAPSAALDSHRRAEIAAFAAFRICRPVTTTSRLTLAPCGSRCSSSCARRCSPTCARTPAPGQARDERENVTPSPARPRPDRHGVVRPPTRAVSART